MSTDFKCNPFTVLARSSLSPSRQKTSYVPRLGPTPHPRGGKPFRYVSFRKHTSTYLGGVRPAGVEGRRSLRLRNNRGIGVLPRGPTTRVGQPPCPSVRCRTLDRKTRNPGCRTRTRQTCRRSTGPRNTPTRLPPSYESQDKGEITQS